MKVQYDKEIAQKSTHGLKLSLLFRISSAVEQWTVNPLVVCSNHTSGDFFLDVLSLVSGFISNVRRKSVNSKSNPVLSN
jgi:hypothetical protein